MKRNGMTKTKKEKNEKKIYEIKVTRLLQRKKITWCIPKKERKKEGKWTKTKNDDSKEIRKVTKLKKEKIKWQIFKKNPLRVIWFIDFLGSILKKAE